LRTKLTSIDRLPSASFKNVTSDTSLSFAFLILMNSSLNYFFYWNIFYSNTKYSFSCCSTDFLYSDFENVFYSLTSYYPCFFCFIHSTFSCMIFYLSLIIIFFSICLFSSSLISCVSFLTSLFIQSRSSFPFFIFSSCLSS